MRAVKFFPLFLMLVLADCTPNEPRPVSPPKLNTIPVYSITHDAASSGGKITSDGNSPITLRGIVWDTHGEPTIESSMKSSDGSGPGTFTSSMSGLNVEAKYFVRAYAINKAGTAYGNEIVFETLAPPSPTITSFSPSSGKIGTSVTILGTNFSTIAANNIVKFNGKTAIIIESTGTRILTKVPPETTSGKITVEANGKLATSTSDFSVPIPSISIISPTSGPAGTLVTILGLNFSTVAAGNIVKFNGVVATINGTPTPNRIFVRVPPGATTGKITVEADGHVATSISDFSVSLPSISSFSPASGPAGTSVTIVGTNFSTIGANIIVKFNGVKATLNGSPTTTSIVTKVPAGATTGKITVEVDGHLATSISDFSVSLPSISSFSPISGPAGTSVTIHGTNFSTNAFNNIVKFNGKIAIIDGATGTSIFTTVPAGATSGKITVEADGHLATSVSDFTVISILAISSFFPLSGTAGTSVTIQGTEFSTTAANNIVRFNGKIASIVGMPTATSIVATVPADATTGKITVETDGETATSASDFTLAAFSIKNGSFEEGSGSSAADWYTTPESLVSLDNTTASLGLHSIKFSSICQPHVLQQQVLFSDLVPGDLYKITFKYKSDLNEAGYVLAGLSETLTCSGCTGPGGLTTFPVTFNSTGNWSTFSGDVQAPTDNKIYYFTISFCVEAITIGNIWVDEVSLVKN